MDGIDFNDSKFLHLRCKLDANDLHIYNDPRSLPCGQIACFDCIKKMIDHKNQCLCKTIHDQIDSIDQLAKNDSITKEINENSVAITEEIVAKLLEFSDNIKGSFEEREKQIDDICQNVKQNIDERVEQLKAQLDVLHKELLNQLEEIKAKVYEELEKLNSESEAKIKESKELSENMDNLLQDFEANKKRLEDDIYRCQENIEELKALDENFHRILRKVSFEPSDWTPDAAFIGTFNCEELLSDDDDDDDDGDSNGDES